MTKQEAIKKLEETVGAYLLSGKADNTTCGEWREILETLKKDIEQYQAIEELLKVTSDNITASWSKAVKNAREEIEEQRDEVKFNFANSLLSEHDRDIIETSLQILNAVLEIIDKHTEKLQKAEPSATPTREHGEWIPVSEGLPKCNGVYEVTMRCEDGLYVSACYFDGQDTWHNDNRINFARPFANDKVIAWMPKPEPYKEGEQHGNSN